MLTRSPPKAPRVKLPLANSRSRWRGVRMLGDAPLVEIMPTRVYLLLLRMQERERVKALQSKLRMRGKRGRQRKQKRVKHQRRDIYLPDAIIKRIESEAKPVGKDAKTAIVDDKTFDELINDLIAGYVIEKVTAKK
jgi:hypothetical protein